MGTRRAHVQPLQARIGDDAYFQHLHERPPLTLPATEGERAATEPSGFRNHAMTAEITNAVRADLRS